MKGSEYPVQIQAKLLLLFVLFALPGVKLDVEFSPPLLSNLVILASRYQTGYPSSHTHPPHSDVPEEGKGSHLDA